MVTLAAAGALALGARAGGADAWPGCDSFDMQPEAQAFWEAKRPHARGRRRRRRPGLRGPAQGQASRRGLQAAAQARDGSVIQGLQPVTFMPAVMFSTFWVPAAPMPDWYRWISDHNPATPIIDAGRSIMLGAADWDRVVVSVVVLACIAGVTYAAAARRLARLLEHA